VRSKVLKLYTSGPRRPLANSWSASRSVRLGFTIALVPLRSGTYGDDGWRLWMETDYSECAMPLRSRTRDSTTRRVALRVPRTPVKINYPFGHRYIHASGVARRSNTVEYSPFSRLAGAA
jgi:hypothetical protein